MARWSWEADAGRTEWDREESGGGRDLPLYPRVAYYWRRFQTLRDCAKRWSADLPIKPFKNCGVYTVPNDTEPELVIVVGLTGAVTSMHVHNGRVRTLWSGSWDAFQNERRPEGFPVRRVPRSEPPHPEGFDFRQLYKEVEANGGASMLKTKSDQEAMAQAIRKTRSAKSAESVTTLELRLEAIEAKISLVSWLIGAGLVMRDRTLRSRLARLFSAELVDEGTIESELGNIDDQLLNQHLWREWKSLFHPLWFAYTSPTYFFNRVVTKVDPEFLAREVEDVMWRWGCGALLNTRVADKWRRASAGVQNLAIDLVDRRVPFLEGRIPTKLGLMSESQDIAWEAVIVHELLRSSASTGPDPQHRLLYEKHKAAIAAFRGRDRVRGARVEADRIVAASRNKKPSSVKKDRARLSKKLRQEDAAPRFE